MSGRALRVLLVTPDFPPAKGGIQLLLEQVVRHAPGLEVRVLTLGEAGAEAFDREIGLDVRRVASAGMDRRLAALGLNLASLREALAFRPDAILSGHVVASLGAIALRERCGSPSSSTCTPMSSGCARGSAAAAVRAADAPIAVS